MQIISAVPHYIPLTWRDFIVSRPVFLWHVMLVNKHQIGEWLQNGTPKLLKHWAGEKKFIISIPQKLFVWRLWSSQPFLSATEPGEKTFLGKALKRSWLSRSQKPWSTGRSQPWGRSITSQLHWLPVAANRGSIWQPAHRREEGTPQRRK